MLRERSTGAIASAAVTDAPPLPVGGEPRPSSPPCPPGPGGAEPATAQGEGTEPEAGRSPLRSVIEWVVVIAGAVLVALVVKTFLFQAFYIPSPSMSPTLVENDRVLVNKLAYRAHDVRRGDVVVFERPPTESAEQIKDLIKRVVGISGDHVSIQGDRVRVNGRLIDEPYVHGSPTTVGVCGTGDVTGLSTPQGLLIPKHTVFVMGDNRTNSHDGRCFGPIAEKLIVGRAFLIIWPPSKVGTL